MKIAGHNIPNVTQSDLNKKIDSFYISLNEQIPEINEKLKFATGENKRNIEDFKTDVLKMKELVDKLVSIRDSKGIKAKFKYTKFVMVETRKAMYLGIKIARKWKKFDCNIENFPT